MQRENVIGNLYLRTTRPNLNATLAIKRFHDSENKANVKSMFVSKQNKNTNTSVGKTCLNYNEQKNNLQKKLDIDYIIAKTHPVRLNSKVVSPKQFRHDIGDNNRHSYIKGTNTRALRNINLLRKTKAFDVRPEHMGTVSSNEYKIRQENLELKSIVNRLVTSNKRLINLYKLRQYLNELKLKHELGTGEKLDFPNKKDFENLCAQRKRDELIRNIMTNNVYALKQKTAPTDAYKVQHHNLINYDSIYEESLSKHRNMRKSKICSTTHKLVKPFPISPNSYNTDRIDDELRNDDVNKVSRRRPYRNRGSSNGELLSEIVLENVQPDPKKDNSQNVIVTKEDVKIVNCQDRFQMMESSYTQVSVNNGNKDTNEIKKTALNIENKLEILIQSIQKLVDEIKVNTETSKSQAAKDNEIELLKLQKRLLEVNQGNYFGQCCKIRSDTVRYVNMQPQFNKTHFEKKKKQLKVSEGSSDNREYDSDRNIILERRKLQIPISLDVDKFKIDKTPVSVQITVEVLKNGKDNQTVNSTVQQKKRMLPDSNYLESPRRTFATISSGFSKLYQIFPFQQLISHFTGNVDKELTKIKENESPKIFVCDICGFSFRSDLELSNHVFQHSLDHETGCKMCRETLERMKPNSSRTMPNVKVFSCRYCGQAFTRAYCAQRHECTCQRNNLDEKHSNNESTVLS